MPWRRDFPEHAVPRRILNLVDSGLLEDVTQPEDPAPSFVAKTLKGAWIRLWVEHPDPEQRRAGPWRYRVEVATDLAREGRPLFEDNSLEAIWPTLISNIKILGVKSRFKLLGGGGRRVRGDQFVFGDVHAQVFYAGSLGHWYYYDVELTTPAGGPITVREHQVTANPKEAAMAVIRGIYQAYADPQKTITKGAEHGWDRNETIALVRAGETLGPEYMAPAFEQATEEWFGLEEEAPRRSPIDWFPFGGM